MIRIFKYFSLSFVLLFAFVLIHTSELYSQKKKTKEEIQSEKKAKEEDYCSMCGEFCALRFSESISKKIA